MFRIDKDFSIGGLVRGSRIIVLVTGLSLLFALCGSLCAQSAPQAPIILKGAPMGGVRFDHTSHLKVAGKCVVCHHASKPEKQLKAQQEACTDCHTKPPTPPVKTSIQAAFHNPNATAGLCIGCHQAENSHGKAAPVKCTDCHKKESA